MLKKIFLLLSFLLVFSASVTATDILNLSVSCPNNICVPDRVAEWNLTVRNIGDSTLRLLGFRILDAATKEVAVEFEEEQPIEIIPTLTYTYSTKERLPYPTEDNILILNICLITEPAIEDWADAGKRIEHCYADFNFTVISTPCLENYDCSDDYFCENRECIQLNCSYCQFPEEHICKDYQCCISEECQGDEICENNVCNKLKCLDEEYIINHTCSATACKFDEGIVDFKCTPLNCQEDEYLINHRCVKLNCTFDEYAFNHSCVKLNCTFDQLPIEHQCRPLNCSFDEYAFNHTCVQLDCTLLQKPEEHECRINSRIIIYPFLLLIILFLMIIDFEKYFEIQKKSFINGFLKKIKAKKGEDIKINTTKVTEEKTNKEKNDRPKS